MGKVKHSQGYENINFSVSLQYLKKEVRNKNYFLHANKYQSVM